MNIHDEIRQEAIKDNKTQKGMGPVRLILGLLMTLILLIMILPGNIVKDDPEPSRIPSYDDIIDKNMIWNLSRPGSDDIRAFVDYSSPSIKITANRIATYGCRSEKICQAKAIYYFVRDNINYIGESDEYFQTPQETLFSRGGDCDDHSILLASMLNAIGIKTRFVFVPKHVYIEARVEDDPLRNRAWIPLDATCRNCDFGSITYSVSKQEKHYLA